MDGFWHSVELFIGALLAIIFSFFGMLTRLAHEHSHGDKISVSKIALGTPSAIIMGVIGTAVGQYLHTNFDMPEITGGALGGALGYLGPTMIGRVAEIVLRKWTEKKGDS